MGHYSWDVIGGTSYRWDTKGGTTKVGHHSLLALIMVRFTSKEDDVARISTSIYVTNFPNSFSAKDLFQVCKQYGHVVDSFIPEKKSKVGKRFGFVRFINVFNVDRLVGNLCTIWVNRLRLQANLARFQREPLNDKKAKEKKKVSNHRDTVVKPVNVDGSFVGSKSYAKVATDKGKSDEGNCFDNPVIVLDDDCVNSNDLSLALMGRVKEFESFTNLKTVLSNEGYADIKIRYMGELWVMVEFEALKSKESFKENVGVNSWFSEIRQAEAEFMPTGRIAWVEIEGIPFKFWSYNTFNKVAVKWGKLLDVDDKENSCYHSKRICIFTKGQQNISENFKLIYRGKTFWIRAKEVPGWVPEFMEDLDEEEEAEEDIKEGFFNNHEMGSMDENSELEEVPETIFEQSNGPMDNISEDPFDLYTLLNKKAKNGLDENTSKDQSLKFPPGFTPNLEEAVEPGKDEYHNGGEINKDDKRAKDVESQSGSNGRMKRSEMPRSGGSFLGLMEEVVKVGQTMGYNMEGCVKNLSEIIESHGESMVNR
ncbi:RNA-directed DNA polymerase, eukaryota, reverse transcriptase zinc-binding domain protein [Tanacetum coccineum]